MDSDVKIEEEPKNPERIVRARSEALDAILGIPFSVLDKGFVRVVDYMGDESSITQAARVSYGKGTKKISEDIGLIRYLFRHSHTTPFEMCEIKLHLRIPMDCWRQYIRHRTASVNEYSTRYSEAIDDKQETAPDQWRLQSGTNKQGSGGMLASWDDVKEERDKHSPMSKLGAIKHAAVIGAATPGQMLSMDEKDFHLRAAEIYKQRLFLGVAKEQARKDLPLSTYCYDSTTEVLTDSGFLPWPLVNKNHLIGIWDNEKKTLVYEKPEYLTKDPFCGRMYRVNHRGVDLLVTPNHKMWVDCGSGFGLKPANELGDRTLVRYTKCAPYECDDQFDDKKEGDSHALLSLMGFFIGDGCAPKTGDKNALVFSLKRKRKIKFLQDVCARLGWEVEKRGPHYIVRRDGITDLWRDMFYDEDQKFIPAFMKQLNREHSISLLEGLRNSDGCTRNEHGSWRFDTTSFQVSEAVVIIGVHAGYAVNTAQATVRQQPSNDVYHIHFFSERSSHPVINQMNRNTSLEHYDGFVYCAKTRTGVMVVRRNGKVCLSGNTEAYWKCDLHNLLHFLQLRMDSHAQLEIRSYADEIGKIVSLWVPNVWAAFNDYHYRRNAVLFSAREMYVLGYVVCPNLGTEQQYLAFKEKVASWGWTEIDKDNLRLKPNRERAECEAKLTRLGLRIPWSA